MISSLSFPNQTPTNSTLIIPPFIFTSPYPSGKPAPSRVDEIVKSHWKTQPPTTLKPTKKSRFWALFSPSGENSPAQRKKRELTGSVEGTFPITTTQDKTFSRTPETTSPSLSSAGTLFSDQLTVQSGTLLDAPLSVMKELLFPASDRISLQSLLETEHKFSDPTSYFYEVNRAKTLLGLQAKRWAESSGNEDLSKEEQIEAYLFLLKAASPLEKPEWKTRTKLRENGKGIVANSTSLEVAYASQFLDYLRDHEKSYIRAEIARIFFDSRLSYSEFNAPPKAIWTVSTLINEGAEAPIPISESSGLGLYDFSPIILQTLSNRYFMICPNGQLFFYEKSPIQTNGLPDQNAIVLGLGMKGNFSSWQLTAAQAPPNPLFSIQKEIEARVENLFAIDTKRTSHLIEDCQLSYSDFTEPCLAAWIIGKKGAKTKKLEMDPIFGYGLYAHPPMLCLTQSARYILIYPSGGVFSPSEGLFPYVNSLPVESNHLLSIGSWESKVLSTPFSIQEEVARRMQENFSIDVKKQSPLPSNTLSQAILQIGLRFHQMITHVVNDTSYNPDPDPKDFLVNHRQLLSFLLTGQTNSTHVETLSVPDFQSGDFFLNDSNKWEEIERTNNSFIIPKFLAKNMLPFTKERLISLRLDAIGIVPPENSTTTPTHDSSILNGSLLDIRITTMERLLLFPKQTENRWNLLQVANWFLSSNAPSYDPDRAAAFTYLESLVWAEKSDNQNLPEQQRIESYLKQIKTLDPELATSKLNDTEKNEEAWKPQPGTQLYRRLLTLKSLLQEDFEELSEKEQFKMASEIYDVNAEGYSEELARELAKAEMETCKKEANSPALATDSQECLYSFSCTTQFPEPMNFIERRELAELFVRRAYPNDRYEPTLLQSLLMAAAEGHAALPTTFEDLVTETLNLGSSNGLDREYYAQFSRFLHENGEILTEMRAEGSFKASNLPCSDYVEKVKRAWEIKRFAPVYGCWFFEYSGCFKEYFPIEETGANIYPASPVIFESASGRFGMITPNGNLFIYEESPLTPEGELSHYKAARGLGLHNSPSWVKVRPPISHPFMGWSMPSNPLSTLQPLRDLMKSVHLTVIETEIEKFKENNYSPTVVQQIFFSIIPFLKLIVDQINDEHAKIDIPDLIFDCADVLITLVTLGIPITKLTSATIKSIKVATKGLSGVKKSQVGIRTALNALSQSKHTGAIVKEAVDFIIPVFTVADLAKTTALGFRKLTKAIRKKANILLEKRGLLKTFDNAPSRCRRIVGTRSGLCSPALTSNTPSKKRTKPLVDNPDTPKKQPKARDAREGTPDFTPLTFQEVAQQRLATALGNNADTLKDVIFEKMRKEYFLQSREEATKLLTEPLGRQYKEFKNAKKLQKKNAPLSNDLKTTYESLGGDLLARESSLFEKAQGEFVQKLETLFKKMKEGNPNLQRTDYVLDFPKVKLELDLDPTTILNVGYPVIRIVEDGISSHDNISFLLRLIQSIIGKGPLKHDRVYYEIAIRDIRGKVAYRGFEATPKIIHESPLKDVSIYSRVDVPQVFVGQDNHIKYEEILRLLNGDLLRHLDKNERNLAKVVRDFMNKGTLSQEVTDPVLREQVKERLSAFALITQISEEVRTPNTGTAVDRLLTELATVDDKNPSFLKIEWQGTSKTLLFPEIFHQKDPLLSFMKKGGASEWREAFKNQRTRMEQILPLTNFKSPIERDKLAGINKLLQQTPLQKKPSVPASYSRHKRILQEQHIEEDSSEKEGASWKQKAMIITIIATALPCSAAILVPLATCYAIQWYQKKRMPKPEQV